MFCSDKCMREDATGAQSSPVVVASSQLENLLSTERRDSRFLYESPLMKPVQTHMSTPPISPLLIASDAETIELPNTTSASYRTWLLKTH